MNRLRALTDELAGLFVDDGSLAVFAIALIVVVTGAVKLMNLPGLAGAVILLVGLVAILVESLMRATRARKR